MDRWRSLSAEDHRLIRRAQSEKKKDKKDGGGVLKVRGIKNPSDSGLIQVKPRDTRSQKASVNAWRSVFIKMLKKNTLAEK